MWHEGSEEAMKRLPILFRFECLSKRLIHFYSREDTIVFDEWWETYGGRTSFMAHLSRRDSEKEVNNELPF
jgi:hypothetical protein